MQPGDAAAVLAGKLQSGMECADGVEMQEDSIELGVRQNEEANKDEGAHVEIEDIEEGSGDGPWMAATAIRGISTQSLTKSSFTKLLRETSLVHQARRVADYVQDKTCHVCLTDPRSVRLVPCGHACLCATCYGTIMQKNKLCPVCRALIRSCKTGSQIQHEATFIGEDCREALEYPDVDLEGAPLSGRPATRIRTMQTFPWSFWLYLCAPFGCFLGAKTVRI